MKRIIRWFKNLFKKKDNNIYIEFKEEPEMIINKTDPMLVWKLIKKEGKLQGLAEKYWEYMFGICKKETVGFDNLAVRYERNYKWLYHPEKFARDNHISVETETIFQKTSVSICQVMGGLYRELGGLGQILEMTKPEVSIDFGTKYFKSRLDKYSLDDAISAYNAGSPISSNRKNYVGVVKRYANEWRKYLADNDLK